MKIEYLYAEVANIFGEYANVKALEMATNCQVVKTSLNERPKFLDEDIDLVYMGTMTEENQLAAIDRLRAVSDEVMASIEKGQRFFITGNALEIFGKGIEDVGKLKFKDAGGEKVETLGFFDFTTKRDFLGRYSSLYLGTYGDLEVIGLKSQFTRSYYGDTALEPLFDTVKGPGFSDESEKGEGFRYKNFMATYLLGPIFINNPLLLKTIIEEMGATFVEPTHFGAMMEAYQKKLAEYKRPGLNYAYH